MPSSMLQLFTHTHTHTIIHVTVIYIHTHTIIHVTVIYTHTHHNPVRNVGIGVRYLINGIPCDFVNHFTLFATRKTHFLSSSIPVFSPDCFLPNSPPPPFFPLFLFLLSPSVCPFPFLSSPLLLNTCVQRHQVCYICSGYDHISSNCPSLFCTYCFQKNHRGQVGRERGGRGEEGEGE